MTNKDVVDRVIMKQGKGERAEEFFKELEKEKSRKKGREKSTKNRVKKEKEKITRKKTDRKKRVKDFFQKLDEEKAKAPVPPKRKEKPKEPVSPVYKEKGIKPPKIPTPHLHAQDDSAPKLSSALRNGYTHARWYLNPEHGAEESDSDNGVCIALDGQEFLIEDMIAGLNYNAPIYETSHVGCKCSLAVYNPEKPELEPYYINSGGRWANTKWWNIKYGDDMRVTKTPKPSGDLPDPRGDEKKMDSKPKKKHKQDFDKILQEKIKEAQDANKKSTGK
jgi:hypothetical protein